MVHQSTGRKLTHIRNSWCVRLWVEGQRERPGHLLGDLSDSSACVRSYLSICYSLLQAILYLEGSPPLSFPFLQEKPQGQGERGVRREQGEVGRVGEIAGHLRDEDCELFSSPSGTPAPGRGCQSPGLGHSATAWDPHCARSPAAHPKHIVPSWAPQPDWAPAYSVAHIHHFPETEQSGSIFHTQG